MNQLVREHGTYGLIMVGHEKSAVGLFHDTEIQSCEKVKADLPDESKRHNMSTERLSHLKLGAIDDFYRKTAELAEKLLLARSDLNCILVGGPPVAEDEFVENGYLHSELQATVLGTLTMTYTNTNELSDIVRMVIKRQATLEQYSDNCEFSMRCPPDNAEWLLTS